jgi:signal transduction histidine kinase
LQVFAALRRVGADLGDPLEIERSGGRVLVSGAGIPQQRQQQIHGVLDALPNVSVRFSEAGATVPVPIPPPADSAAGSTPRPAASLLQQKLGGTAQFERFRSTLLDQNDAAMARAFALRRLAQEFPPDAERELTAADLGVLRDLAREHVAVLAAESGSIGATVSPLLGSSAASAAAGPRAEPGPWQSAAEEVLRAAHEMETSLAALLGAAPAENAADLPARFAAAMESLRTSLERCRVLLSYDNVGQR